MFDIHSEEYILGQNIRKYRKSEIRYNTLKGNKALAFAHPKSNM